MAIERVIDRCAVLQREVAHGDALCSRRTKGRSDTSDHTSAQHGTKLCCRESVQIYNKKRMQGVI